MKEVFNPITKSVLLHLTAIIAFIFFELICIFFIGTNAKPHVFVIFYLLDICYFLLLGLAYLPFITAHVKNRFGVGVLYLLPVISYTYLVATIGDILESAGSGNVTVSVTTTDFFRLFSRSFYVFVLAALYWYAKYSATKEKQSRQQEIQKLELEKKNIQLENAYLRAQVNPHLLYNALSSIYTKISLHAPAEAESILVLCDVARYAMQEPSEDGLVALEDDLSNLQRLIALNQMQYKESFPLKLELAISPQASRMQLPPLLFADVVQNIFKYGDLRADSRPVVITIHCDGKVLLFNARNAVGAESFPGTATGLENSRRRIEKHFPGRHSFYAGAVGNEFVVDIKLSL